jgi:hypothetical protein
VGVRFLLPAACSTERGSFRDNRWLLWSACFVPSNFMAAVVTASPQCAEIPPDLAGTREGYEDE